MRKAWGGIHLSATVLTSHLASVSAYACAGILRRVSAQLCYNKINVGLLYNLHVLDLKNKNLDLSRLKKIEIEPLQTVYCRETVASANSCLGSDRAQQMQ